MPKTQVSVAALLLFAALPVTAQAQAPNSLSVRYGDLNLATAAGVAALDGRIKRAVDALCNMRGSPDLRSRRVSAQCRASAKSAAAAQRAAALAKVSQVRLARAG